MLASGVVTYNTCMGKLLTLQSLKSDSISMYYFDDTRSYGDNQYSFRWPSKYFPYVVSIHEDQLYPYEGTPPRVAIRKWIEETLNETVVISEVDKTYKLYHTKAKSWDRMHEVHNVWYQFWFENEESVTAFTLRFGDIVSPVTDTHPTRHYEPTE